MRRGKEIGIRGGRKKRITASDRYHFSWCARWILNRWRMKIVKRKLQRITLLVGEARKLLYSEGKGKRIREREFTKQFIKGQADGTQTDIVHGESNGRGVEEEGRIKTGWKKCRKIA